MTDAAAARRFLVADFGSLIAVHEPRVRALCRQLAYAVEVDDAVQEVFLAVHRALRGYRGEAAMATWIYRIAVRVIVRMRGRRLAGEAAMIDLPDEAPSPEETAIARQAGERLTDALKQIPFEQRLACYLPIRGRGARPPPNLGDPRHPGRHRLVAARECPPSADRIRVRQLGLRNVRRSSQGAGSWRVAGSIRGSSKQPLVPARVLVGGTGYPSAEAQRYNLNGHEGRETAGNSVGRTLRRSRRRGCPHRCPHSPR